MPSTGQIVTITAATAIAGLASYALWFDYRRRNDAAFRKSLKAQHVKLAKAAESDANKAKERNTAMLRAALLALSGEQLPSSPEQQEAFFQEQVAMGEALATKGPDAFVASAMHFFRALKVYPNPVELIMIYQKVVPPPIFALLMELTALSESQPAPASKPAAQASVADIDDDSPAAAAPISPASGSGNGGSGTSDWETLTDEGKPAPTEG